MTTFPIHHHEHPFQRTHTRTHIPTTSINPPDEVTAKQQSDPLTRASTPLILARHVQERATYTFARLHDVAFDPPAVRLL